MLECSEGRCIGEAEGRDNRAIGIDKMRQLEVNVLEDLSRDEVSEPAKGVLFGNAYRLKGAVRKTRYTLYGEMYECCQEKWYSYGAYL